MIDTFSMRIFSKIFKYSFLISGLAINVQAMKNKDHQDRFTFKNFHFFTPDSFITPNSSTLKKKSYKYITEVHMFDSNMSYFINSWNKGKPKTYWDAFSDITKNEKGDLDTIRNNQDITKKRKREEKQEVSSILKAEEELENSRSNELIPLEPSILVSPPNIYGPTTKRVQQTSLFTIQSITNPSNDKEFSFSDKQEPELKKRKANEEKIVNSEQITTDVYKYISSQKNINKNWLTIIKPALRGVGCCSRNGEDEDKVFITLLYWVYEKPDVKVTRETIVDKFSLSQGVSNRLSTRFRNWQKRDTLKRFLDELEWFAEQEQQKNKQVS